MHREDDRPQPEQNTVGWASAAPPAAFFALAPGAAVAGGLAIAPMLALAALIAAPWAGLMRGLRAAWPALTLAALFIAWANITALWSSYKPGALDEMQGLKLALGVLAIAGFTAAAGASPKARAVIRAAAVAAALVLSAGLLVEAFAGMAINRLAQPDVGAGVLERNPGRGVAVLVVIGLGAIGALVGGDGLERTLWKLLAVLMAILSAQFNMAANAAALALGLVAFIFAYHAPRFALAALGLGLGAWVLAAPFVLPWLAGQPGLADQLPLSWQVRLDIWSYVGARIWEAPLLGHGLDASRAVEGLGQVGDLRFPQVPLHPHSAPLQIWFELGAVGAGLMALLLAVGGFMAARALARQPAAAAAGCAGVVALAALWSVSYGAWQEWIVALIGVVLALANAARR